MNNKIQWWRKSGSLIYKEVIDVRDHPHFQVRVASLDSGNGCKTFRGSELVYSGDGELCDNIPKGLGVIIHTAAAADIIRDMTAISTSKAKLLISECAIFFEANKNHIQLLWSDDPTLFATRNLIYECAKYGVLFDKNKAVEYATQLSVHLMYLKSLKCMNGCPIFKTINW